MERIKSMKGIEVYRGEDGRERIGIIYYAHKKGLREMVGDVSLDPTMRSDVTLVRYRRRLRGKYADCRTCVEALKRLDARRAAVREAKARGDTWTSLPEQRKADTEAARLRLEGRAVLGFATCAEHFLADCADDYSNPDEKRRHARLLASFFGDRPVDEIRKADVLAYFNARIAHAPPFDTIRKVVRTDTGYRVVLASSGLPQSARDLTRKQAEALAAPALSPRAPETEIATLSAIYNYILDPAEDGTGAFPGVVRGLAPTLSNPAIGWRPRRRRKTKAAKLAYTPRHRAIVPTPEELGAILQAARSPRQRALYALAFYTFSRPESETCQVRLGDVILSDDPRARFGAEGRPMGRVCFRRTKTGEAERWVPLHAEAERHLRALGLPAQPVRQAGESDADLSARVRAWESAPVFGRTKGPHRGEPWDRASYKKGWRATVAAAQAALREADPEHRDIRGMWLRDTRKGGITAARRGNDPAVVAKLAGHSQVMGDYYTEPTERAAREAIEALPAPIYPADRIPDRISKPRAGRKGATGA